MLTHFKIFSPSGEHVATVWADELRLTLEFYNARRELDIDGRPIGQYTAVACENPKNDW